MIKHYVLTMTGAAKQLSDVLPAGSGGANGPQDTLLKVISLQPDPANAAACYVGEAAVSATVYGVRLEPAAAGVPPAPFILGEMDQGGMRLSDFYVIGANTEKLHILLVTF